MNQKIPSTDAGKLCKICNTAKALSEFYRRSGGTGYGVYCKLCSNRRSAELYKKNRPRTLARCKAYNDAHRDKRRADNLYYKYNLSAHVFETMKYEQAGLCAICHEPPKPGKWGNRELSVDHNHKTGRVRSLLCSRCNVVVGLVEESIPLLHKIILYVAKDQNA